jgi:hypothetical protein
VRPQDLLAFARRKWDDLAASRDEQWLVERRRRGVAWCVQVELQAVIEGGDRPPRGPDRRPRRPRSVLEGRDAELDLLPRGDERGAELVARMGARHRLVLALPLRRPDLKT